MAYTLKRKNGKLVATRVNGALQLARNCCTCQQNPDPCTGCATTLPNTYSITLSILQFEWAPYNGSHSLSRTSATSCTWADSGITLTWNGTQWLITVAPPESPGSSCVFYTLNTNTCNPGGTYTNPSYYRGGGGPFYYGGTAVVS